MWLRIHATHTSGAPQLCHFAGMQDVPLLEVLDAPGSVLDVSVSACFMCSVLSKSMGHIQFPLFDLLNVRVSRHAARTQQEGPLPIIYRSVLM